MSSSSQRSLEVLLKLSPSDLQQELEKFDRPDDPTYGDEVHVEASRYWGDKLHINDLYENYNLVFDGRHREYEILLSDDSEAFNLGPALYTGLSAAYPQIAALNAISGIERRYVVFGCVSKYSPSDIAYFIEVKRGNPDPMEEVRRLRIQEKLGYYLEWRLSSKTLVLLENALGLDLPSPH